MGWKTDQVLLCFAHARHPLSPATWATVSVGTKGVLKKTEKRPVVIVKSKSNDNGSRLLAENSCE